MAKGLSKRHIPTDVKTRWNSTHDLLDFSIKYQQAIDALTSERSLKLRAYEMDSEEWEIATELCKVLKVSLLSSIVTGTLTLC